MLAGSREPEGRWPVLADGAGRGAGFAGSFAHLVQFGFGLVDGSLFGVSDDWGSRVLSDLESRFIWLSALILKSDSLRLGT